MAKQIMDEAAALAQKIEQFTPILDKDLYERRFAGTHSALKNESKRHQEILAFRKKIEEFVCASETQKINETIEGYGMVGFVGSILDHITRSRDSYKYLEYSSGCRVKSKSHDDDGDIHLVESVVRDLNNIDFDKSMSITRMLGQISTDRTDDLDKLWNRLSLLHATVDPKELLPIINAPMKQRKTMLKQLWQERDQAEVNDAQGTIEKGRESVEYLGKILAGETPQEAAKAR